jgi:hypothetical protein
MFEQAELAVGTVVHPPSPADATIDSAVGSAPARRPVDPVTAPPVCATRVDDPFPPVDDWVWFPSEDDLADASAAQRLAWAGAFPVGASTGRLLAGIDPASLDRAGQVQLAVLWQQVDSWVAAHRLTAMHAVSEHPSPYPGISPGQLASTELGAALALSDRTVGNQLVVAEELAGKLTATCVELAAGRLTYWHAYVLVDELINASAQTAAAVQAKVLPTGGRKTPGQLRRAVRAALAKIAPDELIERAEKTRSDRSVRYSTLPDCAAEVTITGPVDAVRAFYAEINRRARQTVDPDDPRNLDQRRFDVATNHPFDTDGVTPVPAPLPDDIADHLADTDPDTDTEAPDEPVGSAVLADTAGDEPPVDEPVDDDEPADEPADEPVASAASAWPGRRTRSQPTVRPGGRTPKAARRLGGVAGDTRGAVAPARTMVDLTLPLATLLGLADDPGHLADYGPIPAELARRIAEHAAYRFLIHDDHGRLLHYDPLAYTPSTDLARHIIKRDHTCRFPGCTRPAIGCDIDHAIPHAHDGPTDPTNCGCLCRFHHRLKTHTDWHLKRLPDGSCHWTSPTGRTYLVPPYDHHQQE